MEEGKASGQAVPKVSDAILFISDLVRVYDQDLEYLAASTVTQKLSTR